MRAALPISIICFCFNMTGVLAQTYTAEPVSGNSKSNDFAPVLYKNGFVFCSDRKRDILSDHVANDTGRMSNLYFAESHKSGARLFNKQIQTYMHEGPATFSRNGDTIIFTRSLEITRKNQANNEKIKLGLFLSVHSDKGWSEPIALPVNDPKYNMAHPSLSPDGKRLYFASDMPGGHGRSDIYYTELSKGTWSKPVNLGGKINGPDDEYFPLCVSSDMIYFASNRKGGLGGFDMYSATLDHILILPLPEPFNSKADDFSLTTNADMTSGYFTSTRGAGDDNIYYFTYDSSKFENCFVSEKTELCYSFAEAESETRNDGAVIFTWDMGDGTTETGVEIDHCYPDTGDYIIRMSLYDTLTKLEYRDVAVYRFYIEYIDRPFIDCPDTISLDKPFDFNPGNFISKPGTRVFWNYGDGVEDENHNSKHTYKRHGSYRITMLIQEPVEGMDSTTNICIYKDITVLDPKDIGAIGRRNWHDGEQKRVIHRTRQESEPIGRFFADVLGDIKPNQYQIVPKKR